MNNTMKMCLGTFITATLLLGACAQKARYIETGVSGRITAARYPRAGNGRIIAR